MSQAQCTNDYSCDDIAEICEDGLCKCKPFFYYNSTIGCKWCPDILQSCLNEKCCGRSILQCIDGICRCGNGNPESVSCTYIGDHNSSTPMYITASQIALSAALIMGIAALSMVVYRLCTHPRYLSARQRALASQMGASNEGENVSYASYIRASLTSMQIRVLTRLRDRPPTYDSRATSNAVPEAPPPYEGVTERITLPPPYVEVVVSSTGYTNTSFNNSEPDNVGNRNTVSCNCDITQHTADTCDKTSSSVRDKADDAQNKDRIND